MQVKCSYCKSPIASDSKDCEWCGSLNPVDLGLFQIGSSYSAGENVSERSSAKVILNERSIKEFLNQINNINTSYKNSGNQGIFSSLMNRLDGVNFEEQKIRTIQNFNDELDDKGLEMILERVMAEKKAFEKKNSDRSSFLNPNSSGDLINRDIMVAWSKLLRNQLGHVRNESIKKEILLITEKI
ncbi:MAG: hypothetical protein ACK44B_02885 [Flavobacteriales bacterium]|jgi:hypothetical protein